MKLLLLPCILLLAACSTAPVQPWERGNLARPDMAWDTDPLHSAMRDHVNVSKEGSSGGLNTGGGGCGCY
ncbi:MAG: DUF4266 domain-containing protein [Pseudomonadota bacterium]